MLTIIDQIKQDMVDYNDSDISEQFRYLKMIDDKGVKDSQVCLTLLRSDDLYSFYHHFKQEINEILSDLSFLESLPGFNPLDKLCLTEQNIRVICEYCYEIRVLDLLNS